MNESDFDNFPNKDLQDINETLKKIKFSEPLNEIALFFFIHLYNLKYSKFKTFIHTFPREIHLLNHKLTYFELSLLKNDIASDYVKSFAKQYKRDYNEFNYVLRKKIDKKILGLMFNNEKVDFLKLFIFNFKKFIIDFYFRLFLGKISYGIKYLDCYK